MIVLYNYKFNNKKTKKFNYKLMKKIYALNNQKINKNFLYKIKNNKRNLYNNYNKIRTRLVN